ncbi:hypothetical protein AAC978_03035 [Desulfitobacterium sp. THU1]
MNIAFICFITFVGLFNKYFFESYVMNFGYNVVTDFIYYYRHQIIGLIFGLILGLDHIIEERKKTGTWRINRSRVPWLFIPLLLIVAYYPKIQLLLSGFIWDVAKYSASYVSILLGYLIFTGLDKQ